MQACWRAVKRTCRLTSSQRCANLYRPAAALQVSKPRLMSLSALHRNFLTAFRLPRESVTPRFSPNKTQLQPFTMKGPKPTPRHNIHANAASQPLSNNDGIDAGPSAARPTGAATQSPSEFKASLKRKAAGLPPSLQPLGVFRACWRC